MAKQRDFVIMFYVYVLQSKSGRYIGFMTDLKRRINEHNTGQSTYTKRDVWELLYYEAHTNETDARRRERYLKTSSGHMALSKMLKEALGEKIIT